MAALTLFSFGLFVLFCFVLFCFVLFCFVFFRNHLLFAFRCSASLILILHDLLGVCTCLTISLDSVGFDSGSF